MSILPKWMNSTPINPDQYASTTDTIAKLQLANGIAAFIGLGILAGGSVLPKEYRPYALSGLFSAGVMMSLIGASKRILESRLDILQTGEVNAYENNISQNLTIGSAIANTFEARHGGKLRAELQAQQFLQEIPEPRVGMHPENITYFDLKELRVSHGNDEYKHVLVLAPTGSGKTTLLDLMSIWFSSEDTFQILLSPQVQQQQFQAMDAVVGQGANYGDFRDIKGLENTNASDLFKNENISIAQAVKILHKEYQLREKLYQQGVFRPVLYTYVDEWRAQGQLFGRQSSDYKDIIAEFLTGARKLYMPFVFFTTIANVKSISFEGEGDLRNNFTVISLGTDADTMAAKLVDSKSWHPDMLKWWNENKKNSDGSRLCIVNGLPCKIPSHKLSSLEPTFHSTFTQEELVGNNEKETTPNKSTELLKISESQLEKLVNDYCALRNSINQKTGKKYTPSGAIMELKRQFKGVSYQQLKAIINDYMENN